jgi:transposase
MRLTETQRIEILIMLGCGEKTRTHNEVRIMFNNKYPNREPVSQSTISRIEAKWRETGTVKDLGKPGRPGVPNDKKLDILVSLTENPNLSTT